MCARSTAGSLFSLEPGPEGWHQLGWKTSTCAPGRACMQPFFAAGATGGAAAGTEPARAGAQQKCIQRAKLGALSGTGSGMQAALCSVCIPPLQGGVRSGRKESVCSLLPQGAACREGAGGNRDCCRDHHPALPQHCCPTPAQIMQKIHHQRDTETVKSAQHSSQGCDLRVSFAQLGTGRNLALPATS